jgi:LAO/AO transport system kinase
LLELADVFVVNKADRPGAGDARRDLEYMLDLGPAAHDGTRWRAPIVTTTATLGTGIAELADAIERHRVWMIEHGELERRRAHRLRDEIRSHALALFATQIDEQLDGAEGRAVLEQVTQRRLTPAIAARTLLANLKT